MSSDNIKKLKIKGGTIKFIVMVVLLVVSGIFIVVYGVYTEKQYAEVAGSILYDNQDNITQIDAQEVRSSMIAVFNSQASTDKAACELQGKVYKGKDYTTYDGGMYPLSQEELDTMIALNAPDPTNDLYPYPTSEQSGGDELYWFYDDPTTWTYGLASASTSIGNYGKEVATRAEEGGQDVATMTLEDMLAQNRTNMSTGFCLAQTEIDAFNKKYTPDEENKVKGDLKAIKEYNDEVEGRNSVL